MAGKRGVGNRTSEYLTPKPMPAPLPGHQKLDLV